MKDTVSKYQSLIITAVVGVLCLLLLLLNLTFEQNGKTKPLMIEIAMLQESNYGNTDKGQGKEEPQPAKAINQPKEPQQTEVTPQPKVVEKQAISKPKVSPIKTKTQQTTKKLPTVSPSSTKKNKTKDNSAETTKSKINKKSSDGGDEQANAALQNILGGKGKAKSNGQGNSNRFGNVGDPKGNSDSGKGIGENWKTRVPKNQSHNCNASGIVIVDIVVNANGSIKRATPRVTNSQCLANRAKELVLQYVTAFPGADGRRGSYKVVLK